MRRMRKLRLLACAALVVIGLASERGDHASAMENCSIISRTAASVTGTCYRDILVPSGYDEYFKAYAICSNGQVMLGAAQWVPGNRSTATCYPGQGYAQSAGVMVVRVKR